MSKLYTILVLLIFLLIYGSWFVNNHIIGGDWPYFYENFLLQLPPLPPAWSPLHHNGLGGKIITYSLDSYLFLSSYLGIQLLHLPWSIAYKILWHGVFLGVSIVGGFYLGKKIFQENLFASTTTVLIFVSNTYILMISSGGQMGVVLAYALTPAVLGCAITLNNQKTLKKILYFSLILSLLLIWDVRIFYIMFVPVLITSLFYQVKKFQWTVIKVKELLRNLALVIVFPYVLALMINSFWIYPSILNPYNPLETLGKTYTSVESLRFFSFTSLSNSFSLLHPNWPENIFGKVSFQKPEFLVLCLLAFIPLMFYKKGKSGIVLLFTLIALVGIFLSKGASEPFGNLYILLFENIPGFKMFRDSTKWYVLTVLAYSVLIPYALLVINRFFKNSFKSANNIIFFVFLVFWVLLIWEAVTGKIGGTFASRYVSDEYLKIADIIHNDKEFYRTLWVPRQHRFAYYDYQHPPIEAQPLFNATNSAEILAILNKPPTADYLRKLSIRYVIIPHDNLGEIFLEDRKYDHKKRLQTESMLDGVSYLKKIYDNDITIYETPGYNALFTTSSFGKITYSIQSQSYFTISQKFEDETEVIFSQRYSPSWKVLADGNPIEVKRTNEGLMRFVLPSMAQNVEVVFLEQNNYNVGWIITAIVLVGIFSGIVIIKK